jgi:hypothetical protein
MTTHQSFYTINYIKLVINLLVKENAVIIFLTTKNDKIINEIMVLHNADRGLCYAKQHGRNLV